MSQASKIEELANQLIHHEYNDIGEISKDFNPIIRLFERLRISVSKVLGAAGYNSLLRRSLDMAKVIAPSLETVSIGETSTLGIRTEVAEDYSQLVEDKAGFILLTQFLSLLVLFIGEPLAMSLVQQVWLNSASIRVIAIVKDKP